MDEKECVELMAPWRVRMAEGGPVCAARERGAQEEEGSQQSRMSVGLVGEGM